MNLTERLNKHLKSIKEISELNAKEIEKAILKRENNSFGKLVIALIKPTLISKQDKYVIPSFNVIKPLLIADIKDAIKEMQKEGWDESVEEIAKQILYPIVDKSQYDSELGDYVDTTFLEEYTLLYEKDSNLKILEKLEGDIVDYLYENIEKNYRALIQAVK